MKLLQLIAVAAFAVLVSCRGGISEKPPVHLVLDMDFQDKIKAQSEFDFEPWEDGRGMRTPVAGTIARGTLAPRALENYQSESGDYLANPIEVTMESLERGRERYNIYCSVCHDRSGSGKGLVLQRAPVSAFAAPPHLATEARLRDLAKTPDAHLFQTITEGRGTMPAYGHMIPVEDRWKIVQYLRALQNRFN